LKEINKKWFLRGIVLSLNQITINMKALILVMSILGVFLIEGCAVYAEPVGGFYARENVWYYKDRGGREWHENHRYHHGPGDEHHDDRH